jgi:acyl-CoA thioesterase FadM
MNEYTGTYLIRWSDLDANGHVNYAAYIDATGDLRYRFFSERNFPPEKFEQLGIGPIYTAIHARFFREVRMGETITITYSIMTFSNPTARKQSALTLKEPSSIWPPASLSFQPLSYCKPST